MSGPFGSDQWMYSSGGYEINQSLRFNDDDTAYLNKTFASTGNRKTWTWSGWVKLGNIGTPRPLFGCDYDVPVSGFTQNFLILDNNNKIRYFDYTNSTTYSAVVSTQILRDCSSWYHIVFIHDTTQATASERIKIYLNGEQVTALDQAGYPVQNRDASVNYNINQHKLGGRLTSEYLDGYLADVHFIDGQALDASYFGETDADYGHWKPIKYTGSYGTNGFYLDFSNSSSLGEDQSGNSNNWTSNNLAATDVVLDSPTNNFATMNPLARSTYASLSEGNLRISWSDNASAQHAANPSTIPLPSSGKWYFELSNANMDGNNGVLCGICTTPEIANLGNTSPSSYYAYRSDANNSLIGYQSNTGNISGLTTFAGGTAVLGIAVDLDNGTFKAYVNNVLQSTGYTGIDTSYQWILYIGGWEWTGTYTNATINFGQDSSFAGNKTAQGNTDANGIGDFYYAPPSGYLALCTQNLPAPTVAPADHFNTLIWTGAGNGDRSFTGVGFQPDFVWTKIRSQAYGHLLYDALRGTGNAAELVSSSSNPEGGSNNESYDYLSSFDSDGFSSTWSGSNFEAYFNKSGESYVAWNWKANGTGVSNTDGTITSTVSANVDAGFSIVSYTGTLTTTTTSTAASIGHGLSSPPDLIITKRRTAAVDWDVRSSALTSFEYRLKLNSTATPDDLTAYPTADPTSSVFYTNHVSTQNISGEDFIAYCFHSVDSFSKVGSYTGNGSTDGPFVYTGFRPAWVMIKRTDTSGDSWFIFDVARDTINPMDSWLGANITNTETVNTFSDALSNGFKLRNSISAFNGSGGTYIFMAFAENPFKYANAR